MTGTHVIYVDTPEQALREVEKELRRMAQVPYSYGNTKRAEELNKAKEYSLEDAADLVKELQVRPASEYPFTKEKQNG